MGAKWVRIARLYEQQRDDYVRPGPGFKQDMIDLVTRLGEHRGFDHLHPGLSHYMLTLAGENNRRSLTIGWQCQGCYHISACSFVEAKGLIGTLQDTMQHMVQAKSIDMTLLAYSGDPSRGYGERIRGWDSVISYYQNQVSAGSTFAQQMLNILPEIRARQSFADTQIWAYRSLRSLAMEIPESRRVIIL